MHKEYRVEGLYDGEWKWVGLHRSYLNVEDAVDYFNFVVSRSRGTETTRLYRISEREVSDWVSLLTSKE